MIAIASSPSDPYNEPLLRALGSLARPFPLPYGDAIFDAYWEGAEGADAEVILVLIERKRVLDFINSVTGGHHLKQVQSAHRAGFRFQWLIVEGLMRRCPDTGLTQTWWSGKWRNLSEMQVRQGRIPDLDYSRVEDYWNQMDVYMGVRCRTTANVSETAQVIRDLYRLFQKPPENHHTLSNLYQRTLDSANGTGGTGGTGGQYLIPPTLLERVAMQLPGVGWERGKAMARELGTFARLCEVVKDGDVKALMAVPGIGRGIAKRILETAEKE